MQEIERLASAGRRRRVEVGTRELFRYQPTQQAIIVDNQNPDFSAHKYLIGMHALGCVLSAIPDGALKPGTRHAGGVGTVIPAPSAAATNETGCLRRIGFPR